MFFAVPKIFAVAGIATFANILIAQANDASTGTLAIVGLITMVSTALIGAYGRFREVRARADAHDIRNELATIKLENEALKADRDRWKALYEAIASGRALPRSTRRKSDPS